MSANNKAGTVRMAITSMYSRSACHARSARPVAAQMDKGTRETNPAMDRKRSI